MSEETSIRVNFGRPMPIFPLNAVSLLPHGVLPLHIFEPRYRQMVNDALDGAGQIAMAVFQGDRWQQEYHGRPPIRPAVCVGHILEHQKLSDGRYNLALQGVCRARVISEMPAEEGVMYRLAMLEPVGDAQPDEGRLRSLRETMQTMLSSGSLTKLRDAEAVAAHVRDEDIPSSAIIELLTLSFITNPEQRYELLAEPDPAERARMVIRELESLESLIRRAERQQKPSDAPKGCSWN